VQLRPKTSSAEPLLRLPVEALGRRVKEAIRLNPLLEEEEPARFSDPTGWAALDRDVLEFDYEGTVTITAPMELEKETLELIEGLDSEFDDHYRQDVSAPEAVERGVEEMAGRPGLYQELKVQLDRMDIPDHERPVAEVLLGSLNESGYLDTPLVEVAKAQRVAVEQVEAVLKRLQEELEPAGVMARTPQEALIIQLWRRGHEESMGYAILWNHFDDLLHGRWKAIARKMGCSVAEVERAIHDEIAPLTLRLGASAGREWALPLVPDLIVEGTDVSLNEEPLPQVGISQVGLKWLEEGCTAPEQRYLEKQLAQAKRFLKHVEERNRTLLRIGQYLVDLQADYMAGGQLQPLTLRHAAQALALPLTTIQRAVSGKLIATPRGVLPLRALFTSGYAAGEGKAIAAQTIRTWIADWVASEETPLSDAEISARLKEQGIDCSRRTVAKYRSQLHLPTAAQRRRK